MYLLIDNETKEPQLANSIKEASVKSGVPYDNLAYQFSRKKMDVFDCETHLIRKVEDADDALKYYFENTVKPATLGEYLETVILPTGSEIRMIYVGRSQK